MSLKKDKQKVLGEVFDDERIKTFLSHSAPEGVDPDYHALEIAYRGMKVENFVTFLDFFIAAERNINATNPQGKTLLQQISNHRLAEDYIAALKQRCS